MERCHRPRTRIWKPSDRIKAEDRARQSIRRIDQLIERARKSGNTTFLKTLKIMREGLVEQLHRRRR
jgi:hypothetical protein